MSERVLDEQGAPMLAKLIARLEAEATDCDRATMGSYADSEAGRVDEAHWTGAADAYRTAAAWVAEHLDALTRAPDTETRDTEEAS